MCRSSDHECSTNGLSSPKTKGASRVVVGVLIASLGLFFAPRLHADLLTLMSPDRDILVNRSWEPSDLSAVSSGGTITVTIDITNNEDVALRGFYYSDQVPNGWVVSTVESAVDGAPIAGYAYEEGGADEIYTGFTPSRWALELPQGAGLFSPTHPIPASGGTARIVYTMLVSPGTGDDYAIEHDGWAGWLETEPAGTAVFGYQDIVTPLSADFSGEPRFGLPPLTVQFTDLSTGNILTRVWDFGDGEGTAWLPGPIHAYHDIGYYTVTLTVQNAYEADVRVRSRYIHITDVIHYVYLPMVLRSYAP